MDLAPAAGLVIHSDATAEEDLSRVKSDAAISQPNTYHKHGGGRHSSWTELHQPYCNASFFFYSTSQLDFRKSEWESLKKGPY